MKADGRAMIYRFSDCVLDCDRFELLRSGAPVHVEPQVFDLLRVLAQRAGEIVSKDSLVREVWNDLAVSDATINARISAARKAVGDDGTQQAIIRTVHRRGFSLIAEVSGANNAPTSPEVRIPEAVNVRYARAGGGPAIAWTDLGTGPDIIRIGHWLSHLERDRHSPIFGPLIAHLSSNARLIYL